MVRNRGAVGGEYCAAGHLSASFSAVGWGSDGPLSSDGGKLVVESGTDVRAVALKKLPDVEGPVWQQ
jgi:hypothetical protein